MGIIIVQDTLPGFPAHTLPPHWRKALTLGADSGYPGGKAVGIPFLRGEKSFRHAEAFFRASRSSEKWGSSSCRTPFPGFPHTPFRPIGERLSLWGQTQGIPAAKPSGYPFCVAKSLFATQRHFSELQEVLKNGDHHRAGHPSGFPAHTLPPRWRKVSSLGGQTQGIPAAKAAGIPFSSSFLRSVPPEGRFLRRI